MAIAIPLGKLEEVRVREVWPGEARNFTPWLAQEGLSQLSEDLGVELELICCEHPVGRYSLDILARQVATETPTLTKTTNLSQLRISLAQRITTISAS